jgi:hypothetical protein
MYQLARVVWDATREGDRGYVELTFDDPIRHDDLMEVISGLNKGTFPDRFA